MTATKNFLVDSFVAGLGMKAPCVAVAITNITLSGEQTVNGVAVVTDDRVLVTAQAFPVDNGIYDVSTGAWTRSGDFDGNRDVVSGTQVVVSTSTIGRHPTYQVSTANPITIGSTGINFTEASGPNASYDLTQAEIDAGLTTDDINDSYVPGNVLRYGAVGDGVTDDTTAIQDAIDVMTVNGGEVLIPQGAYITTGYLKLKDNVYLVGKGYGSRIHNTATSGFAKVVIASGNVGDPVNANSMFDETGYDLDAVAPGDKSVTLITAGEASNFAVGGIVGIQSNEVWGEPSPNNQGKWLNQNEITAISGAVITLRWAVPDTYTSSAGNRPTLHSYGALNGYDGTANFMAKNCGARNLRLTQVTGGTSGWYAIFPSGVNQHYENLWMDNCSSMVGSNNLSYSTFRNLQGRFEAGCLDFAEWQNNNLIENIHGTRFYANANLNRIGISMNKGADMVLRNVHVFLEGWGKVSAYEVHRGRIQDCYIVDSGSASDTGSTEAVLLGFGNDCEAINCHVINQHKHGIHTVGERGRITRCRVPATNASYYAAYAPSGVDVCYVHDNEFGIEGSITARDRFFQQTAQSENAHVYNNTGYVEHEARKGRVNWAGFVATSGTDLTVLKSVTLPATTSIIRGYRVFAAGARSGTAGAKTINLKLDATTLAQVSMASGSTVTWSIEAIINVRDETDATHVSGKGLEGTTIDYNTFQVIAGGLTSDATLKVDAVCADGADTAVIYQFIVEPIIEMLE